LLIADPELDSDGETQSANYSDHMFDRSEITEISIHTPAGEFKQNINSPLNLKFATLDDSSEEMKSEEEAHSGTIDDEEMFVGDNLASFDDLDLNTQVEVALSNMWFQAKVVDLFPSSQFCTLVILQSFLAQHYELVGIPITVPFSRIQTHSNDKSRSKTLHIPSLNIDQINLVLNSLASVHYDKDILSIELGCRQCWNAWDLVYQKIATVNGFSLQKFLNALPSFKVIQDDTSSDL